MRDAAGRYVAGSNGVKRETIGTVKIRTRRRGNEQRAWVKIAEPNVWKLRAQAVWESTNGPLQRGMVVHHKDENKLNDAIDNLEALTKAEHIAEHRDAYKDKRLAASAATRRRLRWSTKSATKRTGRPPSYDEESLRLAIAAIDAGESPNAASRKFGVSRTTLYRRKKNAR